MALHKLKVGLLTALYERHDLARIVLEYYDRLSVPGVELVKVAVGSEGEASERLAEQAGWAYIESPNDPLGAKWNAGLGAFEGTGVEGVCIVGSDDLLSEPYFEWLRGHIETGAECFSLRGCTFYDLESDLTIHLPRFTSGAGRYFSRSVLDRHGWKVWPDERNRFLDGAADQVMGASKPRRWKHCGDDGVQLVDIKSETNMWTWEETMTRARKPRPLFNEWWSEHFPGIRERLQTIAKTADYHG